MVRRCFRGTPQGRSLYWGKVNLRLIDSLGSKYNEFVKALPAN